jgi:hypothetical protein
MLRNDFNTRNHDSTILIVVLRRFLQPAFLLVPKAKRARFTSVRHGVLGHTVDEAKSKPSHCMNPHPET